MRFHEYQTLRNRILSISRAKRARGDESRDVLIKELSRKTAEEARLWFANICRDARLKRPDETPVLDNRISNAYAEEMWARCERPYYNVWPIATELAESVRLDLPFSSVRLPFEALLLRNPVGREIHGLSTSLVHWWNLDEEVSKVTACCTFTSQEDLVTLGYTYRADECVENWLIRLQSENQNRESHNLEYATAASLVIRLIVFIGLLSKKDCLITPIVLANDQRRYEECDDEDARKHLEDRAARRHGRGFDFGKVLEKEREQSPHWRNPHPCLFWTGHGRTIPLVKLRSGSVVQKISLSDVPTGYLGPEQAAEDRSHTTIYFIEAVGQNRIKIGKADDPGERLRQLQTGSAVELRLVGTIQAPSSREAEIHALFAADRLHGEWFQASDRLVRYIEERSEV